MRLLFQATHLCVQHTAVATACVVLRANCSSSPTMSDVGLHAVRCELLRGLAAADE